MKVKLFPLILFCVFSPLYSQVDTTSYQWPDVPLNSSKVINGTFCEFRDTGTSDHFHNAVDIGEPDGNPVYACLDGFVFDIVNDAGSNSYVSVRSEINGKWKRITYLHIVPNPALYTGMPVSTGKTVVGSIYSGMGHVHLIERELVSNYNSYAAEINNIRAGGGLKPFSDNYKPVMHANTLKFYTDNTRDEISSNALFGKVDIKLKIEEVNGTSYSDGNNGTYLLGYRIWNADTSTVEYEQFPDGIAYRFDRKPLDSDVHNVFVKGEATLSDPIYWLTNGKGADYINSVQSVTNNYFDTELLAEGKYVLEIFTEDTRSNKSNLFRDIRIATPPESPSLEAVVNFDKKQSIKIYWDKNQEADLLGYRLYYSVNAQLSTWRLAADETILTKDITSYSFNSTDEFINPITNDIYFFYMTAVDSSGSESRESKIFSRAPFRNGTDYPTALIVDGFEGNTTISSWRKGDQNFNVDYFIPLFIADSTVISTTTNDALLLKKLDINDYDMVFWFNGDDGGPEKALTTEEQQIISAYLENGGNLLISGSEIGLDLGTKHMFSLESDSAFYADYLKARFVYGGDKGMNKVSGASGSTFDGLSINIGQVYDEDKPDDIDPVNGSATVLNYNTSRTGGIVRTAGIAYSGSFGSSTISGKLIYLPFALETTADLFQRKDFMMKALDFFDLTTDIENEISGFPFTYKVSDNYPNPFNPSTKISVQLSSVSKIKLEVYNILGQKISDIVNGSFNAGKHEFNWNAGNQSSGIYFAIVKIIPAGSGDSFSEIIKMSLIK